MIKTQRVATLKKFLEEYPSRWKTILNNLLSLIGGCSVTKIQLPVYYKECLDTWSDLNGSKPTSRQDVLNEII